MAGFNTAISGIRAASTALDVAGNNIANASTIGFKSSRTEFADIYATAAVGAGSSNTPGSGVLVSDIAQDFSGGNVQFTNNNLDLSIDGGGFFMLDDGRGGVTYTRNGAFELDKDGFIISKSGENLQGYALDSSGNRLPITDLQVSETESPPKATEKMALAFNINEALDAETLIVPYDRDEADSYTFSTTVGTFDSLGNEHTLRYDMVEQQAKKEVHTYEQAAAGAMTVSGITLTSPADFSGTNGSLSTAKLLEIQTADPRVFNVEYKAAAAAPVTATDTVKVIFKSEATETGSVIQTGLANEVVTTIASNEVQRFGVGAAAVVTPIAFEVAGVPFSITASAASPATPDDIMNAILAKESQIRDANPNIESLSYDSTNNELVITYKAESGDVGDLTAEIKNTTGTFFTGTVDGTTGLMTVDSVIQGDNSFEGVYRMYSFLNPLGQRPEALNIGKLPDAGDSLTLPEIGPIVIKFNPSNGILTSVNGVAVPTGVGATVPSITVMGADPANPATEITLDLTGTTQFADDQIVKSQSQDGYSKGDLTGVSFSSAGVMVASYSNNQSTDLGVVAIASFANQDGLQPNGDTQWLATSNSGGAILNPPGTALNGSLRSSALESSNVDLSAELVALIEFQRNFQASSKTLETLNTVTQNILQI